ncbi:MAG: MFS transporter [Pseudoflavonifractor sp.]
MEQRPKKLRLMTLLLVLTLSIGYVQQKAPSPLLRGLSAQFGLAGQDALLNLSVSITYPMSIIACLAGGALESRLGIRRLYLWTQVLLTAGVLLNFCAFTYPLFLVGRVVYSAGFGLSIPFIGSAIMNWYSGRAREGMNTLNGMFPFIGTVISFSLMLPLSHRLGDWKIAMGIWGAALGVLLLIWVLCIRRADLPQAGAVALPEKGIYKNLWRRKNIRLLCIIFVLDFFCYSYMVVVLPTLLAESGGMDPTAANLCAALAFPLVGLLGSVAGGGLMSKSGRRKPLLILGQLLKLLGVCTLCLTVQRSIPLALLGTAIFGFGNGMWMPVLYTMPMELEGMTPSRTGAAFAFLSACAFLSGFLSPTLGGLLTTFLTGIAPGSLPLPPTPLGLNGVSSPSTL